jgi:hypothetical protein
VVDLKATLERLPAAFETSGTVLIVPMAIGDRLFGFVAGEADHDLDFGAGELQFANAAVNHACLALALQEARLAALSSVQPPKSSIRRAATA